MLKNTRKFLFKVSNIPISLILILAAFMRLYKVDSYMTFLGDEGRDVLVVYGILHGNLTLLGPTASVGGFFLGPIYYYLMAPALFLANYNPVGPAVMVALFGVATVFLVYVFVKRHYGLYSAIIASLIYTVSPLVIIYSRSSWNPNTVPFFSLLTLYVLYEAVTRKSWKMMLASGVFFGILLQLHYLATFLGVIIFFYILTSHVYLTRKLGKTLEKIIKDYTLFGFGVVIGWFPFLLFELRHGFANIQSIFKFVFKSGDTGGGNFTATTIDIFTRLFERLILAFPRTEDIHLYNFSKQTLTLWQTMGILVGITCVGFLIYNLMKSRKEEKLFLVNMLLFLWLFFGVFLFGFYKKSIYDYYFGFMFPLPVILFASMTSVLLKWGKIAIISVVLVVVLIFTLNFYMRPFKIQGNYQANQVKTISEFVLSKTGGKPYNFAVISGGNSDHAYRYFFEINKRPPTTIEYEGADPERKSVTDQLLVVCESLPCEPVGHSLWEIAGFGQAEIVGEWDVSVLKVYKLKHASQKF